MGSIPLHISEEILIFPRISRIGRTITTASHVECETTSVSLGTYSSIHTWQSLQPSIHPLCPAHLLFQLLRNIFFFFFGQD